MHCKGAYVKDIDMDIDAFDIHVYIICIYM